jgi:hypothetical protein
VRNICEVGIDTDENGDTIICGKPAVDYYITDQYDKFWQCQYHWDQHAQACRNMGVANPSFDDYIA